MSSGTTTRIDVSTRTIGGRTIAVVTWLCPAGGLVTWTEDALAALGDAVSSIDTTQTDAVAFTGTGTTFGAGANLESFRAAVSPADGERIATSGYDAFNAISRLAVPTFAFLNGTAVGGALELALRADYRTVAASAGNIGLPEVRLGLVPGWGGLTSLCELVGITAAADMAITRSLAGRHLSARDAIGRGLADVLLDDDDFVTLSLAWATEVLAGALPASVPAAAAPWNPTAVRDAVEKRIPGSVPAADTALALLSAWHAAAATAVAPAATTTDVTGQAPHRTTARLARGTDPFEVETIAAFGRLLHSDECRASIYSFFTLQAARKRSRAGAKGAAAAPVGVVGGGLMATQLALVFAERLGAPTLITDLSRERVDLALERVAGQLDRAVTRGSSTPADRVRVGALVTGTTAIADFADRNIVIEAVFEDLAVKRDVWASVERVVSDDTLLLTNTSSLSIADQGAGLRKPDRLIGFHFFNPVAVLPLVEIVRGTQTSPQAIDAAFALAGALGKTAVLVKDSPGFVVNRLLTRLFSDVLALIDAGADARTVDTALVRDGLPMTPLALLGYIGPAVQLHILESMHAGFDDRFTVSPSLRRIVELRLPGYLGTDGALTTEAAAAVHAILPATGARTAAITDADAVRALLLRGLADEAGHMLDEGTVERAEDIDACMILGANYPHHTGGLTPLLDRSGASIAARGVPFHEPGVAGLHRPPAPNPAAA